VQSAVRPMTCPCCGECRFFAGSCWRLLDERDRRLLEGRRSDLVLSPGQVLFQERHPCHGLHCIASGLLALRKSDGQGNSVILRLAHPGEVLGFPAFCGRMDYTASAEALGESRICFFPLRLVEELLARNPELHAELARLLALELRGYGEARLQMATLTVERRFLDLLIRLLPECGREDESTFGARLRLPLSRRDLAAMLGVRPETVARAVRHVAEQGLALIEGREVHIPDLRRLRRELR